MIYNLLLYHLRLQIKYRRVSFLNIDMSKTDLYYFKTGKGLKIY